MGYKRKAVSARLRFEVFKRDSFTCQYCGRKAPEVILHVDHILAVANGGKTAILNLITSCANCNGGKSDKLLSDQSAVSFARKQADELHARKEQVTMMAKWYAGLNSIEDSQIDIVNELIVRRSGNKLSSVGRGAVSRLINKYTLSKVMQQFSDSFAGCIVGDSESFEKCFKDASRSLKYADEPFHISKSRYLLGIVRNRFNNSWDWQTCFEVIFKKILEDHPETYPLFYTATSKLNALPEIRDRCFQIGEQCGFEYLDLESLWNATVPRKETLKEPLF